MEKIDDDSDIVECENNTEETKKLNFIKKQLLKTTDFLRTGYQNRQRKKVAPLNSMTTVEENEHNLSTLMKNKTKLERKNAINTEDFQSSAQNENREESDEEEDEWDLLAVSDVEYQAEELFCDVYHQCANLVGQDINNGLGKNSIVDYLKKVFEFRDHKSEMLIRSIRNKQYPRLTLKVNVLRTRDVLPTDIFSIGDLFYIIWISSDPSNRYLGRITKDKSKPAQNQFFKLPISSNTDDILHLELRDFIPSEEISTENIQINANATEPIASATIMLKDIPSTGQTKWITLKNISKKVTSGKIQLEMMFGSEENGRIALERHRCLVKTLFYNALLEQNNNFDEWRGTFCPEAELIMRQHLIQSDLNAYDDLIAKCAGYIDAIQNNSINFAIFEALLHDLLKLDKKNTLTKEKRKYFWYSARKIMKLCYEYIKNFRKTTPNHKKALAQLHSVLSILQNLTTCEVPSNLNLFPTELYEWVETAESLSFQTLLHEAVVQGTCEWFEFLADEKNLVNNGDEAFLNHMLKIADMVMMDLDDGIDLHEIFVKKQNFSYSKTIYFVYQAKITELMGASIPKICRKIKQLDIKECHQGNIDCNSFTLGSSMCTLFFKIQKFEKIGANLFSNDDTFETFPLRKFHSWFLSVVITWLDIAILKAMRRIGEVVEVDDLTPTGSTTLHSSSAVDMLNTIYQVKKFWDLLEWPDVENYYFFLVKIIEDIFTASIHYADLIKSKVCEIDGEKIINSINNWCVAIINIDFVMKKIQSFIIDLRVHKLIQSLSDSQGLTAAERCKNSLNQMMNHSFENINQRIIDLLEIFAKKMEPSIIIFLQEGAELLHQQPRVIDYLAEHLDENLITLNSKLNSNIFRHFSDVLWEKISNIVFILIENGIEKKRPPTYFSNLKETFHILIRFFKIDEQVYEKENKKLQDISNKIERKFTILNMETPELIHLYFLERLKDQKELESPSSDGELTVKLQINEDEKLIVEILSATNVLPMDSNGQSDPFICVELVPLYKFSFFTYKTKVLKKTLYPTFEEKFTVALTKAQIEVKDALIKFTIKDHDLCKNRYMADAFVRLDEAGRNEPKLCKLMLSRPKNSENDILKSLEARKNDKLARFFTKKEKSKMKSTQ